MYWNISINPNIVASIALNRHIWCIEIQIQVLYQSLHSAEPSHLMYWNSLIVGFSIPTVPSWTVTFDVLKYLVSIGMTFPSSLNRHIWCIEIQEGAVELDVW